MDRTDLQQTPHCHIKERNNIESGVLMNGTTSIQEVKQVEKCSGRLGIIIVLAVNVFVSLFLFIINIWVANE